MNKPKPMIVCYPLNSNIRADHKTGRMAETEARFEVDEDYERSYMGSKLGV